MAPFTSRTTTSSAVTGALSRARGAGPQALQGPRQGRVRRLPPPERRARRCPSARSSPTTASRPSAVPRNRNLPANRDPKDFDLGLCERHDHRPHGRRAGVRARFRTPSLRNVAVRPAFMHNGAFTKLRDVVAFYATRGDRPEALVRVGRRLRRPAREVPREREHEPRPLRPRHRRDAARWTTARSTPSSAFLQTLTDAAYR